MPDIIHLLPDSVANQIAAGEVIQRPASAVKELLENAIDAGSTQIDLIIKDAGKTLIQVTDNGCGMSETDARLSFERHATSKITSVDDLFAIRTMGFRGEALASIAAIAQVELKSRKFDQDLGSCLVLDGSEVKSQEFCHCSAGTSIMVKNLFYNVPARRRFLKTDSIELRHIIEEFQRVAMANPNIGMSFFNDRRPVFQLKSSNLKQRIIGIFGTNFNQRLVPVEQKIEYVNITGFLGKPEFARKVRGEQFFFVNNRFMKHAYLNHAIENAFTELIPEKSFPSYFIFIDINPKEIDINIHPTKTEIKFQDETLIYSVIRSAAKAALGKFSVTPSIDFEVEPTFDFKPPAKNHFPDQPQLKINPDYNPFESGKNFQTPRMTSNRENWEQLFPKKDPRFPEKEIQELKAESTKTQTEAELSGSTTSESSCYQLHGRFIISQVKSGMLIIDQQKAHERILFEKYAGLLEKRSGLSQQELYPVKISLSPANAEIMGEIMDELNLLGFRIVPDEKANFRFQVMGTPADMKQTNIEELIEGIIENYKAGMFNLNLDKRINLARSMAKKTSIKYGKLLQQSEMKMMIDQLFACRVPEVSVDGDNVIQMITLETLMNLFAAKNEQNI